MSNQLKKYGEWFRANKDTSNLDAKIKDLQKKHEEEKFDLQKREENLKKMAFERRYLQKRGAANEEEESEEDIETPLAKDKNIDSTNYKADLTRYKVSGMLFDELQELVHKFKNSVLSPEDMRAMVKSQIRSLNTRYHDQYGPTFLAQKLDSFVTENFGYIF